jgi:hypothetical protein
MKKSLFVAAIAALAVVACKKSETTEATESRTTYGVRYEELLAFVISAL